MGKDGAPGRLPETLGRRRFRRRSRKGFRCRQGCRGHYLRQEAIPQHGSPAHFPDYDEFAKAGLLGCSGQPRRRPCRGRTFSRCRWYAVDRKTAHRNDGRLHCRASQVSHGRGRSRSQPYHRHVRREHYADTANAPGRRRIQRLEH